MRVIYSDRFKRSFKNFSSEIRRKLEKQINYFLQNIRHPSLRTKKYDEERSIWQARADKNIRFYFLIEGDIYILLDIRKHSK